MPTASPQRPYRLAFLAYGIICYAMFFGAFLYLVGFMANFVVPKSVDSGMPGPLGVAILINALVLSSFGIQHSIMARPGFKKWWTRLIPEPLERSTYVLGTNLILVAIYVCWRPMPSVVWDVSAPGGRLVLHGIFAFGVALVLYATFLIDHFDLFGLRQVYLYFAGKPYTFPPFATPALYRMVRNPLMLGWFISFWATPTMTQGHLLFSIVMTLNGLVGILFEERDLLQVLGEDYRKYRRRTPMVLPWPRPRKNKQPATAAE